MINARNISPHGDACSSWKPSLRSEGQAVVEFTLIFVLLLVILLIPADFGIAFYTGQLALSASREGARIAAADPNLSAGTVSCALPCGGEPAGSVLGETAERLSSALLSSGAITLTLDPDSTPSSCDRQVTVTVTGNYNFFFYQLLRMLGISSVPNGTPITRTTVMRWEHQPNVCP